jgi:hypothetical protein
LTYVTSVEPITPKAYGFRALGVKHPYGITNSSEKSYETEIAII